MASVASQSWSIFNCYANSQGHKSKFYPRRGVFCCQRQDQQSEDKQIGRREVLLRSSELATLGAIFHFRYTILLALSLMEEVFCLIFNGEVSIVGEKCSGTKPNYLGVQKIPPSLALCPATKNCVSTSENRSDLSHYAPPWNYNPEGGRGSRNPVSKEVGMQELLDVIKSTKPDKFTPKITDQKDDYVRVEYESPILGFVDDVEFWFPPGKKPIVQYRSASRLGSFDFDINRKRIKELRKALEKKGWASESSF